MSAPQQPPGPGGYSLFPNPNSKPPTIRRPPSRTRRSESRERAVSSGTGTGTGEEPQPHASPPRQGRRTPQHRLRPSLDSAQSPQAQTIQQASLDLDRSQPPPVFRREETPISFQRLQKPVPDVPPREDTATAFSEAQTLVRSISNRSRSSIAKLPLREEPSSSAQAPSDQPVLRSIFPQYNPNLPMNQQEYYPTQTSPTHIPRAVISRMSIYPDGHDAETEPYPQFQPQSQGPRSPDLLPPVSIPQPSFQPQRWPLRQSEMPPLPTESSNDQLKSLWKVVNGWRASPSDGRVFCLKLSQEKDAPVYTLSSRQQPFYNFRIDPTSASAYITLTRHDPSKPYKAPGHAPSPSASSNILGSVVGSTKDSNGKNADAKNPEGKHWHEVLNTTLEEESRRHRPNDGLVALLYPNAASKVALARPDDPTAINMAEGECARLLWDDDTSSYFLVHPALAAPFRVTVDRHPAWSRVEYTLEHHESPRPLARLTRDGTGAGRLEVDTTVAAHIESFFIVDVAIASLLIVAAGDEREAQVESFEPPPLPPSLLPSKASAGGKRNSGGSSSKKKSKMAKWGRTTRVQEMEIDLESQDSNAFAKFEQATKEKRKKLPWPLRITFKVLGGVFKCVVWSLTMAFKALAAILYGIARCLGLTSKIEK